MKRNLKKRWEVLKTLWLPFADGRVPGHAAAACYYILLSMLPASALGMTVLSLLPDIAPMWMELILAIIPKQLHSICQTFFSLTEVRRPTALLSTWVVITLWSASKGVMAISDGLSSILCSSGIRGFIRRRLRAMIVFLMIFAGISVAMLLIVFGAHLLTLLMQLLPTHAGIIQIIYNLRYVFSTILLSVLFMVLYSLLQAGGMSFFHCVLCGFITATGWIICSSFFQFYVNRFQPYQKSYGRMGLLILACLWLQIMVSLFLYSAVYIKLRQDGNYHPVAIIKNAFSHNV